MKDNANIHMEDEKHKEEEETQQLLHISNPSALIDHIKAQLQTTNMQESASDFTSKSDLEYDQENQVLQMLKRSSTLQNQKLQQIQETL